MTFESLQSYNIKTRIPNYFMLFFFKTTSVSQIVAFKVVLLKMLSKNMLYNIFLDQLHRAYFDVQLWRVFNVKIC